MPAEMHHDPSSLYEDPRTIKTLTVHSRYAISHHFSLPELSIFSTRQLSDKAMNLSSQVLSAITKMRRKSRWRWRRSRTVLTLSSQLLLIYHPLPHSSHITYTLSSRELERMTCSWRKSSEEVLVLEFEIHEITD